MSKRTICSVDGCDKHCKYRLYCHGHQRRFRLYGDPLGSTPLYGKPEQLILDTVANPPKDCVIWPFNTLDQRGNYGTVWYQRRKHRAHRLALQLHTHQTGAGLQAAHICGQPECINPTHMHWATQKQNEADKERHGRRYRGDQVTYSKLTESAVRHIRQSLLSNSVLARKYGVSTSTVRLARLGETWGHVT